MEEYKKTLLKTNKWVDQELVLVIIKKRKTRRNRKYKKAQRIEEKGR